MSISGVSSRHLSTLQVPELLVALQAFQIIAFEAGLVDVEVVVDVAEARLLQDLDRLLLLVFSFSGEMISKY